LLIAVAGATQFQIGMTFVGEPLFEVEMTNHGFPAPLNYAAVVPARACFKSAIWPAWYRLC
jgi:hypothetical protein